MSVASWQDLFLLSRFARAVILSSSSLRPSFRRIGIAAGLLDALVALSQSRNISELFLEVAEDNEAAQALYLTCGFQNVGKRNRYYQRDGHSLDAIIMQKSL